METCREWPQVDAGVAAGVEQDGDMWHWLYWPHVEAGAELGYENLGDCREWAQVGASDKLWGAIVWDCTKINRGLWWRGRIRGWGAMWIWYSMHWQISMVYYIGSNSQDWIIVEKVSIWTAKYFCFDFYKILDYIFIDETEKYWNHYNNEKCTCSGQI